MQTPFTSHIQSSNYFPGSIYGRGDLNSVQVFLAHSILQEISNNLKHTNLFFSTRSSAACKTDK